MNVAALAAAALLLACALRLRAARRLAPPLPPLPPPAAEPPPTTILLPARDEAGQIEGCVRSLAAQRGAARVVVVDDHSTDSTPRILARLAPELPSLRRLAARPLAPPWGGKLNALQSAIELEEEPPAPWLLFTDADTVHAPELLARAHAAAAEHALDALSLAGRQHCRGAGEALLVPAVFALLDSLLGDWGPHARGEARPPVANGQFFLLRRAALERAGGLARIAGDPLDDVALAAALAASGARVGFRRAGAALEVRMYRGLAAAMAGWRRNLALFLGRRPLRLTLLCALALAAPALLGVLLGTGAWVAALGLYLAGTVASALTREGADARWAPLWPAELTLLGATLALATIDRARGRTRWRGREIPLRQR